MSQPRQLYRGPAPWLLLAPYILVTLVFTIYPLINAAVLAFYQTNGPASRAFVGLDNFRFIFSDPMFYRALQNLSLIHI